MVNRLMTFRMDVGWRRTTVLRLDLPAGTRHDALVGVSGVTCLEAHLPAGSLEVIRRFAAGTW